MTALQKSTFFICSVCLVTGAVAVWPQGAQEEVADAPEIPLVPAHNPNAMSDGPESEDAGVDHQRDTQELQDSNQPIRSNGHPAAAGNLFGTGPVIVGGGSPGANTPEAPGTMFHTFDGRKLAMNERNVGLVERGLATHGRKVLVLATGGTQSAVAPPLGVNGRMYGRPEGAALYAR